jgi:hypothetical protein
MKKKLTPMLVIKSFLALLLTGFTITQIFISCNGNDNRTTETATAGFTTDIYDSLYYPVYILDAATIMANQELRSNPGTDRSLILKLKFNGISHDTLDIGLIGYPSSNHASHGQGTDTVLIRNLDTAYRKLPKNLIWGNIYVFWNAIKGEILETSGAYPRALKADFSYLKFIPVNHVAGMPWDPYLSYNIEAYNTSGNKIILPGAGSDDSHPSPPAPPAD